MQSILTLARKVAVLRAVSILALLCFEDVAAAALKSRKAKQAQEQKSSSSNEQKKPLLRSSQPKFDSADRIGFPSPVLVDETLPKRRTGSPSLQRISQHNPVTKQQRDLITLAEPIPFADYSCRDLVELYGDVQYDFVSYVLLDFEESIALTPATVNNLGRVLQETYLLESGLACDHNFRSMSDDASLFVPDSGAESNAVIFRITVQGFKPSDDPTPLDTAFDPPWVISDAPRPPEVLSRVECDFEVDILDADFYQPDGSNETCVLNGCYCNNPGPDNSTALYEFEVKDALDHEFDNDPKFAGIPPLVGLQEVFKPVDITSWKSGTFYLALIVDTPLSSLSADQKDQLKEEVQLVANAANFETCDLECRRIVDVTLDDGNVNGPQRDRRQLLDDPAGQFIYPFEISFDAKSPDLNFFDPETHDTRRRTRRTREQGQPKQQGTRRLDSAIRNILPTSSDSCWCPTHGEFITGTSLSIAAYEEELRDALSTVSLGVGLKHAWVLKENTCPPGGPSTFSTKIVVKLGKRFQDVDDGSNIGELNQACVRGYNVVALENCNDEYFRVLNCTLQPLYPFLDPNGKTPFAEIEIFYSCFGCSEDDSIFGYPPAGAPSPPPTLAPVNRRDLHEQDEPISDPTTELDEPFSDLANFHARELASMDLTEDDERLLFLRTNRCWCTADEGNGLKPRRSQFLDVLNHTLGGDIVRVIDTAEQKGSNCQQVESFTDEVAVFFDVEPLLSEFEELGLLMCESINELHQETCDADFIYCVEATLSQSRVRRHLVDDGSGGRRLCWASDYLITGYDTGGSSSDNYYYEANYRRRDLLMSRVNEKMNQRGFGGVVSAIAGERRTEEDSRSRNLNTNNTVEVCPLCQRPESNPNIAAGNITRTNTNRGQLQDRIRNSVNGLSVDQFSFTRFSEAPSSIPSSVPSQSALPSTQPSLFPSTEPSESPTTRSPSLGSPSPTTGAPSVLESTEPSKLPSHLPSKEPSESPTTRSPSLVSPSPTTGTPSVLESSEPSELPSLLPSKEPSELPTTRSPSFVSDAPTTGAPSVFESTLPSEIPSLLPSKEPSESPTTRSPSFVSDAPTTGAPSVFSSTLPSEFPSLLPSKEPSETPTTRSPSFISDAPTTGAPSSETGTPTTRSPSFVSPSPTTGVPSVEFPTEIPTTRNPSFVSPPPTTGAPSADSPTGSPTSGSPTSGSPIALKTSSPISLPPGTELPTGSPVSMKTSFPITPFPTSSAPSTTLPTKTPTNRPTSNPTTSLPTPNPTPIPTNPPTPDPSPSPTSVPTPNPTSNPSSSPTNCDPNPQPLDQYTAILAIRLSVDPNTLNNNDINNIQNVVDNQFPETGNCGAGIRRKLSVSLLSSQYLGILNLPNYGGLHLGYTITYSASSLPDLSAFTARVNSQMRQALPVRLVYAYSSILIRNNIVSNGSNGDGSDGNGSNGDGSNDNNVAQQNMCRCEQSNEFLYTGTRNSAIPVNSAGVYIVDSLTVLPIGSNQCRCSGGSGGGQSRLRHRDLWSNIFDLLGNRDAGTDPGKDSHVTASLANAGFGNLVVNVAQRGPTNSPSGSPVTTSSFSDGSGSSFLKTFGNQIIVARKATRPPTKPPTKSPVSDVFGNKGPNSSSGNPQQNRNNRRRRRNRRRWIRRWRQRQQKMQSQQAFSINTTNMSVCRHNRRFETPTIFSC